VYVPQSYYVYVWSVFSISVIETASYLQFSLIRLLTAAMPIYFAAAAGSAKLSCRQKSFRHFIGVD
jgi:hypothetical protein